MLVTVRPGPGCLGQARPRAACLQTPCSFSCACGPGPAGTRRCPAAASSSCAGRCRRVCAWDQRDCTHSCWRAQLSQTRTSCRDSQAHARCGRPSRASRAWGAACGAAWRLGSVRRLWAGGCCKSRARAHRLCLARRPPSPASLSLRARAAPARHARAALAHAPAARVASHTTHAQHPATAACTAGLRGGAGGAADPMARPPRLGAAQRRQHGAKRPGTCCLRRTGRQRPATAPRAGGHARRSCCGSAWRRSAARARGPWRRRSRSRRRRRRCRSRCRCSLVCLRAPHCALGPAAQPC